MVSVILEVLWMISNRIVDFRFFVKFHMSGPTIIFRFWTIREHVSYESKQLLIKQNTSSTWCALLWKDYGRFWSNYRFSIFCQILYVRTCNNFQFWTTREHVSYASKQLLFKQISLTTWCVLLWKYYGWFLIDLSIYDFSSNFTGPDLQ